MTKKRIWDPIPPSLLWHFNWIVIRPTTAASEKILLGPLRSAFVRPTVLLQNPQNIIEASICMVCGWAPNPLAWSWYIWFEEFYSCILEVRNELHANVMPIAIGCKNFGTWLGIATRVLSHIRALENSVWLCVHTYILLIKETTDHVLYVFCKMGSILNGQSFVLPCSYSFLMRLLLYW